MAAVVSVIGAKDVEFAIVLIDLVMLLLLLSLHQLL